jgi:hypothetical protein
MRDYLNYDTTISERVAMNGGTQPHRGNTSDENHREKARAVIDEFDARWERVVGA